VSVLRYFGIFSAVLAWVIILACVLLNPWFVFTKNAFSDLGGASAKHPWLYNYGLVTVSVFVFLYGVYLIRAFSQKLMVVSASFVLVASIFLALIGIFHEGTYPHVFVSTWFFVQFDMAIFVSGLAFWRTKLGKAIIALFAVSNFVALTVHWPSAATIEAWGIATIDVWALLVFLYT